MDPTAPPTPNPSATPAGRTRPIAEVPEMVDLAVDLLRTPCALTALAPDEARCVVGYMRLVSYPAGATVMREGDQIHTGYMLLLLSGEVSAQTAFVGPPTAPAEGGDTVAISVLGPGNLFGEMGLLDGEPRSMTCVAATRIEAAGLSRDALELLLRDHPAVGARLMTAIAKRLADRLRAAGDQLRIYAQLTGDMQQQIERLKRRADR